MKILVTGGAGFIGSHIVRLLLEQGHSVVVYDNLSTGTQESVDPKATFIKGDIADQKLMEESLQEVDWVIHMASLALVNESVEKPLLYGQNNILGSISLLEAMRNAGVKKIVFSSSVVVYGFPKNLPIKEDDPILPFNPYGATKVGVEAFLSTYNYLYGFDVISLRYFNPFGPGENHRPETHAIPNFIKAALKGQPIPLYWKGEQTRDFIYVEDLAQAHIGVFNLKGLNFFNIGTEKGVKVIDIVNTISDILGKELEIKDLGERKGDVPANYASSQKIKNATGWSAKYSLREGLEKTIDYFKNNPS